MKMKILNNRAFNLLETLFVVAVICVLIIVGSGIHNANIINAGRKTFPAHILLPPGVTDINLAPVPVMIESHLGREWIIATCKTNWSVVVYYPNDHITIKSIRQVNVDLMGNIVSPPTVNNIASSDNMQSYEVTASLMSYPVEVGPKFLSRIESATESFTIQPTVLPARTIFLGTSETEIQRMVARIMLARSGPKG